MKKKESKILIAGLLLALPIVSHAVLVDDFESYPLGVPTNTPWSTTGVDWYSAVEVDPVDTNNQYLAYGASSGEGGGNRDNSRPLGTTYTGQVTFQFDIFAKTNDVDHVLGLCSSTQFDGGAPADFYFDYGPLMRIITGGAPEGFVEISVRDGGSYVDDLYDLPTNTWATVRMEIDFDTETFDLYLDDNLLRAGNGFRLSMDSADTFLAMVNGLSIRTVGIDNIQIAGDEAPLAFSTFDPADGSVGVTNTPTITQIVLDGSSNLDTNSISFVLDGNNVPFTVSGTGTGTNTISHVVTSPFEEGTLHTVAVSVAGINPASDPISNQWSFIVWEPEQSVPTEWTILEDFEAYSVGTDLIGLTAGKWEDISTSGTAAIEETDGTNNVLRYTRASATGGASGSIFGEISETGLASGVHWVEFDMRADAGNDMSAGLAVSTSGSWSSFAAYIGAVGGNLRARDGGSNLTIVPNAFPDATGVTHTVTMRVDMDNQWYDVYFDGELVADNFGFRNTSGPITVFKTYSQSTTTSTNATFDVDNIKYNDNSAPPIPPLSPFEIVSISIDGGNATLEWESEPLATYNILSKSSLRFGGWTTNKAGIASAGAGTTSDSVPVGADVEFFAVEGREGSN